MTGWVISMIPGTVLAPSLWHLILLWYQVPGTRYMQESEKAGKNKNETISWQQWHTTIYHDNGKQHQKIEKIDHFSNNFFLLSFIIVTVGWGKFFSCLTVLIQKLIFSFCFFTIPHQQGFTKIVAIIGKCIACPHEGQCGFWAGPTMVNIKVDCCRGGFFTIACGTFSYGGKLQLVKPSEWLFLMCTYWILSFDRNQLQFLLSAFWSFP